MKFATRISSIRLMAWNTCRSWSVASEAMCARLAGQVGRGWMDALATGLEDAGHRILRQPVDLEVGVKLAELVGDRDVAPGVAEADRRGDVEGPLGPAATARPAAGRGSRAAPPHGPRRESPGSAARGRGPAAHGPRPRGSGAPTQLPGDRPAAARLRPARPRCPGPPGRGTRSSGRAAVAASRSITFVFQPAKLRSSVSASVSSAQPTASSICFVECGSLKHLAEEELGVPAPVAKPVVPVLLGPALVGVEHRVERVATGSGAMSPTWMAGAISTRPPRARDAPRPGSATRRDRTTPRPPLGSTPSRVEHRHGVCGVLTPRVLRRGPGPVRAPVPARVERDDGPVPGQVRDLALPASASARSPMSEGAGRRASRCAVSLPVDPDAVTLDEAVRVRDSGLGSARGRPRHVIPQ